MAQEQQEYQGTGRIVGALGSGVVGFGAGSAVAGGIAAVMEKGDLQHAVDKIKGSRVLQAVVAIPAIYGAYKGWSAAADGKEQFEHGQQEASALRTQNALVTAERDQAVTQLSHAARVLQERQPQAHAVAPSTAPVSASGSAHKDHAAHGAHSAALAASGHAPHDSHAGHATASKEHAAHVGHGV